MVQIVDRGLNGCSVLVGAISETKRCLDHLPGRGHCAHLSRLLVHTQVQSGEVGEAESPGGAVVEVRQI